MEAPEKLVVTVDGITTIFECMDDLVDAFKETRRILFAANEKPKESKWRGARFLLACLDSGKIKDPGGKTRRYCNSILQ